MRRRLFPLLALLLVATVTGADPAIVPPDLSECGRDGDVTYSKCHVDADCLYGKREDRVEKTMLLQRYFEASHGKKDLSECATVIVTNSAQDKKYEHDLHHEFSAAGWIDSAHFRTGVRFIVGHAIVTLSEEDGLTYDDDWNNAFPIYNGTFNWRKETDGRIHVSIDAKSIDFRQAHNAVPNSAPRQLKGPTRAPEPLITFPKFPIVMGIIGAIAGYMLVQRQRLDAAQNACAQVAVVDEKVTDEAISPWIFPILCLPNELIRRIYRTLPLKVRRALRCNTRLAEIEMGMVFKIFSLRLVAKADGLHLTESRRDREERPSEERSYIIPYSDVEEELRIMSITTALECIDYDYDDTCNFDDLPIMTAIGDLKADYLEIWRILTDEILEFAVNHREVLNPQRCDLTIVGINWLVQKMRNREVGLKHALPNVTFAVAAEFLDSIGIFNRETRVFTTTNPCYEILSNEPDCTKLRVDGRLLIEIDHSPEVHRNTFALREKGYDDATFGPS